MGCEHSRSTVAFPLLFPSSVEGGWQPDMWTSFILVENDFTLQGACGSGAGRSWGDKPFVLQNCGSLEEFPLSPTVPPLGSPPRPQAWCPAAMPAGAGSHQEGVLPPKSPQTLPAVSASSCSTQGGFSSLETYLFSPGDSVTPRAGT